MSGRRGPSRSATRQYPRTARVNAILQEVLAEQLERLEDKDSRLGFLTVTGVVCDPDLRHATVLLATLSPEAREGLEEARPRLQSAVAQQVRLRWTPTLTFAPDPAVDAGQRVEDLLRDIRRHEAELEAARGQAPETSAASEAPAGLEGGDLDGGDGSGHDQGDRR
jgi:ribosome-binding factor A